MTEPRSFTQRLRRRKLVQWLAAYLGAAWIVLQLFDMLRQTYGWSTVLQQLVVALLVVGFVAAAIVAWYHGEKGEQKVTGMEVAMLATLLIVAGSAVAFVSGPRAPLAEPVAAADATLAHAVAPEQGSIAVLPFVNMSTDPEQEFFSDGLTEELLNVLAQLPELRVASRTSAFTFKGSSVPIDSIARALRVAHVLEGSVRRDGERLRITAQLIRADNGFHVWSNSYDREARSVFAVQDEIARAIVQALQLRLGGRTDGDRLVREETSDPEAHTLLLRGHHFLQIGTPDGHAQALQLFEEARARDPYYARAHGMTATVLVDQAYRGFGPRDPLHERARGSAEQALALDPEMADAHYALARLNWHQWQFALAEAHFRRALESNPGDAAVRSQHGWLLMSLGRVEEGLAEARRAVELDPVSPAALHNLAALSFFAGDREAALAAQFRALELRPEHPLILSSLANMYSETGRFDEAHATADRALARSPDYVFALFAKAYAHAKAGQRAEAEAIIARMEALPETAAFMLAQAWAGLGDRERTFELLDEAVTRREGTAPDIGLTPAFAAYRSDPRMALLRARIGLP